VDEVVTFIRTADLDMDTILARMRNALASARVIKRERDLIALPVVKVVLCESFFLSARGCFHSRLHIEHAGTPCLLALSVEKKHVFFRGADRH